MQNRKVELIDTTLRDGQQTPVFDDYNHSRFFSLSEKIQIIEALYLLGVRHMELFSPVVGTKEKEDSKEIIKHSKKHFPEMVFHCHSRCVSSDIEAALDIGFSSFNLYMGTSPQMIKSSHGKSLTEISTIASRIIKDLRKEVGNNFIRFSGEDAFRTSWEDLKKVYDPLYEYVTAFGSPDTVGISDRDAVIDRISRLRYTYPNVAIETHFHNDLGRALANSVTAVKAGATFIDCSIWGIAERNGITPVSDFLYSLYIDDPYLVQGYDLSYAYPANVVLADILKSHVPWTQLVTLTNRTHSAGVHINAINRAPETYEAHPLHLFGVTTQRLLINQLAGHNTLSYFLREIEGYDITDDSLLVLGREFKQKTKEMTSAKTAYDLLLNMVKELRLKKRSGWVPNPDKIENTNFGTILINK